MYSMIGRLNHIQAGFIDVGYKLVDDDLTQSSMVVSTLGVCWELEIWKRERFGNVLRMSCLDEGNCCFSARFVYDIGTITR